MTGSRRLSQALSEGDGISVLVHVADAGAAAAAEDQGAEGLVIDRPAGGLREATSLPLLFRGESPDEARSAGADGWVLVAEHHHDEEDVLEAHYARALGLGLECVIDVRDEEELEEALEWLDPDIVVLSERDREKDEEELEVTLDLLPDVPAGKLVVSDSQVTTREQVLELERAGVDAVLVPMASQDDRFSTALAQLTGRV